MFEVEYEYIWLSFLDVGALARVCLPLSLGDRTTPVKTHHITLSSWNSWDNTYFFPLMLYLMRPGPGITIPLIIGQIKAQLLGDEWACRTCPPSLPTTSTCLSALKEATKMPHSLWTHHAPLSRVNGKGRQHEPCRFISTTGVYCLCIKACSWRISWSTLGIWKKPIVFHPVSTSTRWGSKLYPIASIV